MTPETIPWQSYTHINFAFASIDPNTFVVVPADPVDLDLYSRLTALKALAPGLQVSNFTSLQEFAVMVNVA